MTSRIPHDIVTNEDTHNLFVADRENGRVHELRYGNEKNTVEMKLLIKEVMEVPFLSSLLVYSIISILWIRTRTVYL